MLCSDVVRVPRAQRQDACGSFLRSKMSIISRASHYSLTVSIGQGIMMNPQGLGSELNASAINTPCSVTIFKDLPTVFLISLNEFLNLSCFTTSGIYCKKSTK